MCIPGSRVWQLRVQWLGRLLGALSVLVAVLFVTQQGLHVGWVSEAATTQHRFENASNNLTLFLDVKVDSLPEACTWTQHFDLTVPGMPPTIFLTSCLSGGSPKSVVSDKQKTCAKKNICVKLGVAEHPLKQDMKAIAGFILESTSPKDSKINRRSEKVNVLCAGMMVSSFVAFVSLAREHAAVLFARMSTVTRLRWFALVAAMIE